VYLTFVVAAIIIFKHATYLHITSATAESALTQAEVDYCTANIELKIQTTPYGTFSRALC
jgi:hypothetical protein